jgi:hypothetical protein
MLVLASLIFLCELMAGCAGAFLDLDPRSRLPRWFELPDGLSRADVTVTMASYVMPWGRSATFKLWDAHGRQLSKVTATVAGLEPYTFKQRSPNGGIDESSYPIYEVMTASGIAEVIEQKKPGPFVDVSDDPKVKAALGVGK